MTRIAYAPIVALLLSFSGVSLAADVPDRPAGVIAANWVPVSERLGIVLVRSDAPPSVKPGGQPLLLTPPVGGYFMVKNAAGWIRLVIVEPTKGPGDVG